MKKLFVIVLAAIGMVSCMNTDEVIEVNNDNAIAFADAFIENSVRAEINNDNLENFEVWGWMQENSVEAPVFNAMKVSHNGADWTYSPAQYWVPGFTYTFKALSSNNATHPNWTAVETTDGKLGEVVFTNVDGTEDLIYAAPAAVAAPALGETAQPVELEFNHQLAKVKFDFEYAPELVAALELSGLTVEAEEITMKVPGKATIDYSATTPAWILDTTAPQATLHFAKEGVERLTIPAGAAYEYDITFKVKYYQGTNVIKTIDKTAKISLAIEMGKAYNFTATITPDNLGLTTIDFETKVDGWDDAGAGFEPDAAPMAFVPAERTIYVNSAEQLLYLTELNAKWAELFSNGQGTEVTDFYTQNGGQGADYYYKWEWTIKLNADIDLKNITLNAPIDMRKWAFDGLGHTIKNVKIETATDVDTSAALFMGDGYTEFKDLKLENVHVKGSLMGNSTAAILVSDCSGASVENITITNSSVWGGKYTGGVVGYGYTSVNNCTLTNCVVKGGYKCGGVIGYICTSSANGKSVNNNTLTNCTVEGTDGQFAGGKSEYILGKIVGNFNCNGTCGNNTITNMTTSATGNIGKVEAGMTVTYGLTAITEATAGATINIETPVVIEGGNIVLDLEGKTINAAQSSAIEVRGGKLTIKNGNIIAHESVVRAIGGKVIIESGEFVSTGTAVGTPSTYRYSVDSREGGEIIINGGTFKSNNGMINVSSTVTINGGKFENVVNKTMTRHFAYVSAPLTINGGEFYGEANPSAGGCFFCGAAAGGDITINGGQFTSLWYNSDPVKKTANRIFEYYYGGSITVTGGMFNTNGGIATFVTENTDEATKAQYPYVAK